MKHRQTCNECGREKGADRFTPGRGVCKVCRTKLSVAREQERRIAAGTHQRCSGCSIVKLNWKFNILPNGALAKQCAKCRGHKDASRERRVVSHVAHRPVDTLLALLHALPGTPGSVLVPVVRCEIPGAA